VGLGHKPRTEEVTVGGNTSTRALDLLSVCPLALRTLGLAWVACSRFMLEPERTSCRAPTRTRSHANSAAPRQVHDRALLILSRRTLFS